jgi:L-threonylcarbamoyladenylate synthase
MVDRSGDRIVSQVARAVAVLRAGGLVAFPTETVYGLGADATNADAVRKIFAVKGRPSTNPLICHVADAAVARRYAAAWPFAASQLTRHFWPGPLTIVVRKTREIVAEATAGLDTVGLRAPDHPLTLELLRAFGKPLAGPSANKSTHVSPTTAKHVRDELGSEIELILDGGPCDLGIESTVLDLSGDRPAILRPGGASREQIEAIIGPVDMKSIVHPTSTPTMSPGQQSLHYAPRSVAYRFTRDQLARVLADATDPQREAPAILFFGPTPHEAQAVPFRGLGETPTTPPEHARVLYSMLRELDRLGADRIFVEMPPDTSEWTAIRDRLLRATKPLT